MAIWPIKIIKTKLLNKGQQEDEDIKWEELYETKRGDSAHT
jgi:hypothetical protein